MKIPCFFIIGIIRDDEPHSWIGTEIQSEGGYFSLYQRMPTYMKQEIWTQLNEFEDSKQSLSEKQRQVTRTTVAANPTRAENSDICRAREFDKLARVKSSL